MVLHFIDYILLIPLMLLSLTCFIMGIMKLAFMLINKKKQAYQYVEHDVVDVIPHIPEVDKKALLLELISKYEDDVVIKALEDAFSPLLEIESGLDIDMLQISKEFAKIKEPKYTRAALITKRVAHIFYRQYKKLDPNYSSPDFLQVI